MTPQGRRDRGGTISLARGKLDEGGVWRILTWEIARMTPSVPPGPPTQTGLGADGFAFWAKPAPSFGPDYKTPRRAPNERRRPPLWAPPVHRAHGREFLPAIRGGPACGHRRGLPSEVDRSCSARAIHNGGGPHRAIATAICISSATRSF
jgi:hypothetical protein